MGKHVWHRSVSGGLGDVKFKIQCYSDEHPTGGFSAAEIVTNAELVKKPHHTRDAIWDDLAKLMPCEEAEQIYT